MSETDGDPTLAVAQDLSTIERLVVDLVEQAIHDANDREIPGGDALAALAHVASPEAWNHVFEAGERAGADVSHVLDEDENDEPPLQTLLFWSEAWRAEHGYMIEGRPTIGSEANFIRWCLPWAWENEPHWRDMADDIRSVVSKLEMVLLAGKRNQIGVPCFDCGATLVRQSWDPKVVHYCAGHDGVCYVPHTVCPHDRGGLRDDWKCPGCERTYSTEDYARAVSHAHYAFADYLTLDEAAARADVKRGTILVWASRGKVRKKRDHDSGRMTYNVPDIKACDSPDGEVA